MDLTSVMALPEPIHVLDAEHLEAAKKVGRLLQGGGSLFHTPVGGVIMGPVIVKHAYPTVRGGWAKEIACAEGEALVRTKLGGPEDFACWRVVKAATLPEEARLAASRLRDALVKAGY